ncbi:MBL fold metallo-hydrolase [Paenibacillus sp. NPDC056933]|uniref:MBL fold metallo-hydrolase n=1 Tax=Paenibacillus sp. NPDC056933 TaxID=3345968 RepID=UPI0036316352
MSLYVKPLSIEFEYNGMPQVITPALIGDQQQAFLVDCGYVGFVPHLEEALNRHELSLSNLTGLIITHHDLDHVGSLAEIKRTHPHIRIIAHKQEAPYIDGTRTSLRLEQALAALCLLPEKEQPAAKEFICMLERIEPSPVDQTVHDLELLPWCEGMEIIHTPGHTPGHISIYLSSSLTLIAGDAVVMENNGELGIANPQHTLDLKETIRSVQRLLGYEIDTLICYHGGLFQGDVRRALQRLLQSYAP